MFVTVRQQLGLPSTWVSLAVMVILMVARANPPVVLVAVIIVSQLLHRWIDPILLLGPDWPPDSN